MKRNASSLVLGGLVAALLGISTLTGCHDGSPTVPGVPGDPAPSTSQAADRSASSQSQDRDKPVAVETEIIRVIDGDTIVVRAVAGALQPTNDAGTQHTVRLLGIDAAEMNYGKETGPECGAREATDHLESILPEGMPVIVSYDPKADRTDRYSRSLAYVTTRGGTDAGLRQVADGYAMPWYPESEPEPERVAEYRMAADAAVKHRAGAHSQCPTIGRG
jgi:micrococcal nuclease